MAGNPYLLRDDIAILRYIIDGHHESVINGNNIWKQMEKDKVCTSRTWQSLRNRFFKNICIDLSRPEYGLTEDEKVCLRVYLSKPLRKIEPEKPKRQNRFMPKSAPETNPAEEPIKTFALYSLDEDKAILKYILDGEVECFVKGNDLWFKMEKQKICPTRTWQSLKNRFKRYLIPDCSNPQYGLSSADQARLKAWISPQPPPSNKSTTALSERDDNESMRIDSDTSSDETTAHASKLVKISTGDRSKSKTKAVPKKDFFSLDMSTDSDD